MTWGGQFENLQRAQKRLTVILPVTIAIIFVLLFFMFGSAEYAGLVMMNVPVLAGRRNSVPVFAAHQPERVGRRGLHQSLRRGRDERRAGDRRNQPIRRCYAATCPARRNRSGCLGQLRPVLLMVVVALLGMVPAARASGIGSDVQRPLATVVVGGLLSTLFLTLLALPSMYALTVPAKERREEIGK